MSARALPEGWQFGPERSIYGDERHNVLVINERVVAKIEGENFHKAVFTDQYPEKIKQYLIFRLQEDSEHRQEKERLWYQEKTKGVIDCVLSEMEAEESC